MHVLLRHPVDKREVTLQHFFREYRSFVYVNTRRWPYFNQVVTGWYWPIINGLMSTWNDINVETYIERTYKYLQHKEPL